jgi:6-phosphogluconate dehydrogenase
MGANMVRRLLRAGHSCVVFDPNAKARDELGKEGAIACSNLAELVQKLEAPRAVWLMLPAAIVDNELAQLTELLKEGDTVIDGGNSYYRDDIRRADQLKQKGLHYLDVGTSGGVYGEKRGYCLMIGGEAQIVERLDPLFRALAPGAGSVDPTPGRKPGAHKHTAEEGYLHCGPSGAGHFVKMVHNGIE